MTWGSELSPEARIIDAAFNAILQQDWGSLTALERAYPDLVRSVSGEYWTGEACAFRGIRGWITWNADLTAYVVLAPIESVARWMGYRAAADDDLEVTWHGTRRVSEGQWAAQFTVEDPA